MKNLMFKTIVGVFGILAIVNSFQLSAQTEPVGHNQNKDNYKLQNGNTTYNIHQDYVDKILAKKMELLQHYLTVLTEKKEPDYTKTVDKAMQLFNNDETVLVTITNKNTKKVYVKPVKYYLSAIHKLPYKAINISYRNYTTIQNIRRQPDGTYKGLAVLQQEFTGYDKEGNALYHDVVKRNVEVNIKINDYQIPGENLDEATVDVFFGNMGVTEM